MLLTLSLALLMILSAVPLGGFARLHLPKLDFGNLFASAADKVDYSNLTPNQYMAKVLLNHDYKGCLAGESTIPQKQLAFYLDPGNVSQAKTLCNELEKSAEFLASVVAWKTLTFDPSEAYENYLNEEDYYTAILLSILDTNFESSEFVEAYNCSFNKTVLDLSKDTTAFLEDTYELDVLTLADTDFSKMNKEEKNAIIDNMFKSADTCDLYTAIGDDIEIIQKIGNGCTSVLDVVKTVSMYSHI